MTDTSNPTAAQTQAVEHGLDLGGVAKLHTLLNTEGPLELTVQQFRPYAPLFQTTAKLSDMERERLTREYLPLVQWGYRTVHVVAVDTAGQKQIVLRLPKIFVQANTPHSQEHGILAAVNARTHQATDRQDHRSKALQSYMNSFLQSQDTDAIVEQIVAAQDETDQILIDFVRRTQGEAALQALRTTPPAPADEWDFAD